MAQTATLPIETLNMVLNVLAQRPYAEVAEVIGKIQQTVKVEGEPEAEIEAETDE